MLAAQHGQARREVILRIAILNKTLALRAHNVVGEIGDTRGRRCAHLRRHYVVVSRGPADRSQVKAGIFRIAVIVEAANAGVEGKHRGGSDVMRVAGG